MIDDRLWDVERARGDRWTLDSDSLITCTQAMGKSGRVNHWVTLATKNGGTFSRRFSNHISTITFWRQNPIERAVVHKWRAYQFGRDDDMNKRALEENYLK